MSMLTMSPDKQSAWRSPWVIAWVAIVLVVLAVNVFMISLAIDANPGLVVDDYYERGQSYEKNMVARMAKDPGWKMGITVPEALPLAAPALIQFSLTTKEGGEVAPDSVIFYAYRPSDANQDFSIPMKQLAPGRYQAEVTFPLKGVWDTLVSVQKDGDEYNEAQRVIVAPGQ